MSAQTPDPKTTPMTRPDWQLVSHEVDQGCVLWLGGLEETNGPVVRVDRSRLPDKGMYNHPIVVLSRPASDPAKIYFVQMTSFHGRTLEQKWPKKPWHQQTFVPITPAPVHPQYTEFNARYRTLTLENGAQLEKASYINVRDLYEMDWKHAEVYWGADPSTRKKWKLDQSSLRSLVYLATKNAGFIEGVQHVISPDIEDITDASQGDLTAALPRSASAPSLEFGGPCHKVSPNIKTARTWGPAASDIQHTTHDQQTSSDSTAHPVAECIRGLCDSARLLSRLHGCISEATTFVLRKGAL